MPIKLLQTRLSIPQLRLGAISRPRLIDELNDGLASRLTLIMAPAGFGKTTLVLDWLNQLPAPDFPWEQKHCAWVSLDPADNQPVQFFAYLLGALQRMIPGFCNDLFASLENTADVDLTILIQDLLNEFATSGTPYLVVLDDYHVITDKAVHELTNLLVEYLPPNVHILITTRDVPPLDLPRWRARGYLNELTASALRFTHEEAQAFLTSTMRLNLPEKVAMAIETRTEGWVVGLQLAALALRGQPIREDWDKGVDWNQGFTGRNRTVADYLLAEVLEHQPQEIQDFLLCTAILPQFNAPLCDHLLAVFNETNKGNQSTRENAQQMLERLEKSDLFLIPLDSQRYWYRYHQLFAELLQNRLQQTWSAEKINTLHLAASTWFEEQGMIREAIVQAFEAGAEKAAAKLIEAIPEHRLWQSDLSGMISSWSRQLSPKTLENHPGVILYTAATQLMQGKISDLRQTLASMKQFAVLKAEQMVLEAILIRNNGQLAEAFEMLQESIKQLPASADTIQDLANLQLAVCSMQLGELDQAERYTNIIRTRHETLSTNTLEISPIHLQAIQWQGYLVETRGNLNRAQGIYQAGLDRIASSGQPNPMAGQLYARLGGIHYQWNEIQAAQDYYDQAMTWGERTRIADILFDALFGLADMACYYQDSESLQDVIDQFNSFVQDANIPGFESLIAGVTARYWLRMGELEKAVRWANESELPLHIPPPYPLHEGYQILIAIRVAESRALMSAKALPQMLALVEQLITQAEGTQNQLQIIQDYLLKSLILDGLSKSRDAVHTLYKALELGQAGGYIRVYLDTGPLLHGLLQKALSYGEHIPTIRRLLVSFAKEPDRTQEYLSKIDAESAMDTSTRASDFVEPLVESLTDRENEVLQLLANGFSNKAIQEQMFISNNTVRTHIKNLYGKLGVNNRTQAVLRAQDLGLA